MSITARLLPSSGMAKDDKGGEYDRTRQGGDQMSEAEIDYNVMGSFPASDPPSYMGSTAVAGAPREKGAGGNGANGNSQPV